jgi:hypothetical protein
MKLRTGFTDRIVGTPMELVPDTSAIFDLAALGANLGATSARHELLLGPQGGDIPPRAAYYANACFHVVEIQAERGRTDSSDLLFALQPSDCRPHAYLSGTTVVSGPAQALLWLQQPTPPPDRVPWEGGPELTAADGNVRWKSWEPERERLEVEVPSDTALVVADAVGPGWTARVDGHPTAIFPTLVDLMGLRVPAGKHDVELSYRAPHLIPGAALGALGVLVLLTVLGTHRWRRPG